MVIRDKKECARSWETEGRTRHSKRSSRVEVRGMRHSQGIVREQGCWGGKFLQGQGELRWLSEGGEPGADR